VARRGAREVTRQDADAAAAKAGPPGGPAGGSPRGARFSDDAERERRRGTPRPGRPPGWVREDGARDEWADTAPARKGSKGSKGTGGPSGVQGSAREAVAALVGRYPLPPEIAADIRKAADVATAVHREHLVERAESAYGAYERGRFQDALRAIKPVADEAPGVAAVRELAGLAAYRSARWRSAVGHLEAFGALSDSSEHIPVLMDCQRALHKPKKVAALWSELRQSSPDPDVLAEGRIVAAASLADSGDFNGAIAMLATAGASKALRNPSERHIRQWYLLADLYERAGDVPKAREYFERVFRADPEAYDVQERLRGLGPERRPRPRRSKTPTSTKKGPTVPKG
jgi:Tetratricopeptide repeat